LLGGRRGILDRWLPYRQEDHQALMRRPLASNLGDAPTPTSITVLGVGNPNMADDGVGLALLACVRCGPTPSSNTLKVEAAVEAATEVARGVLDRWLAEL